MATSETVSSSHKRQRTENSPSSGAQSEELKTRELSEGWQLDLNLNECMLKMFDHQRLTDVTFRCADQTEENPDDRIRAHKNILAARSPVFETMFFGSWKEGEEIEIREFGSQHFRMFLRLLYSDTLGTDLNTTDLIQLSGIAHLYQINTIVDKCLEELLKEIPIPYACTLMEMTLLYEKWEQAKTVTDFIDKNARRVLMTNGFLSISLDTLTHILMGDTFFANEADIFNRSMEWARKRCNSTEGPVLRKTLGKAFYFLRTPAMTIEEFTACTKRKRFYNIGEYEDIVESRKKNEGSEQLDICNSTRKRVEPNISVSIPVTHDDTDMVKVCILHELVTITTRADSYLTHIKINRNHSSVYDVKTTDKVIGTTWKKRRGRFKECNIYEKVTSEYALREATLIVNLSLNYPELRSFRIISGREPYDAELESPIFLPGGKPSTMKINLQLQGISELKLGAHLVRSGQTHNCANGDVCVKTEGYTRGLVQGFQLRSLDNRKYNRDRTSN